MMVPFSVAVLNDPESSKSEKKPIIHTDLCLENQGFALAFFIFLGQKGDVPGSGFPDHSVGGLPLNHIQIQGE